jgi:hypothetical protein
MHERAPARHAGPVTLDAIRQRDPAFDQTRFLSRAEAVLALVMRARAESHPEWALTVVSDDVALRLRTEMEALKAAGRRQVHQGVRVRSAEIVEAAADDRRDTIAVRFSLEGAAYEAEAGGKPVEGATKDRRRWAEVWWFQRRAGTTTAADDAPLDRCPSCGAPLAATAQGTCAYCQHKLADPTTWVLTRISDTASTPHAAFSGITIDTSGMAEATSKVGRIVGLVTLLVVVLIIGGVVAGIVAATRTTRDVADAFRSASEPTLPPGVTLPPGMTMPRAGPTGPTSTGFVTPVANPRVRAPVNDLAAAAAAVQAKAGRPLMLSDIHLYPDGRIIFEVQALDDPTGADNFVWKGGTVTGPEQSSIGVKPADLYPLAGLELSNLAKLCDAALGAVGIPDGVIDSPYLLKINRGLTWYIPVQSESRSSNKKTYWVAPDGSKPAVF